MNEVNLESGSGKINRGWIALYRKILDNPKLHGKPAYFSLWVHLLLYATHTAMKKLFDNQNIILKPGQLITGRKFLATETGICESTIDRILEWLESEHHIEQRKCSTSRLITIVNWAVYQINEHQSEHPVNISRTTGEHPVSIGRAHTIMKDNEEKVEKEEEVFVPSSSSSPESLSSGTSREDEASQEEKTIKGIQEVKTRDLNCSNCSEEEYESFLNLSSEQVSYLENAEVLNAEDLFNFIQHLKAIRNYRQTPPADAQREMDYLGTMLAVMPDTFKNSLWIKKMVWWYFKGLYKPSSVDLRATETSKKVEGHFYPGLTKDKTRNRLYYIHPDLAAIHNERKKELSTGATLLLVTAKRLEIEERTKKYNEELAMEEYHNSITEEVQAEMQGEDPVF